MNDSLVSDVIRQLAGRHPPRPDIDRVDEQVRAAAPLLASDDVAELVRDVRRGIDGLGPIGDLLEDDRITDLMINGDGTVWVDRGRGVVRSEVTLDEARVRLMIERILSPLGRRVNPVTPSADARLPDGSRVHVIVPPLSIDGPCVTIRRFGVRAIELESLAAEPVADLLATAIRSRANIVVSGGTGSGKTTLLNALTAHLDPKERVVTVEDAAELRLPIHHVVRLETRPAGVEGAHAVGSRELVRDALRMRPDRVLLGEVRGAEALELIQAMNTGHDGSLSTVHANSGIDALRRLETLVLLADSGLPLGAVRDHLAAAVDLIVHMVRLSDGRRRVDEVVEVDPPPHSDDERVRVLATADRIVSHPRRPRRAAPAEPEVEMP